MKSWKIIAAVTLTVIAAALITTVALASAYNPYRTMTPSTSYRGGMMGGWNNYADPTQQYPSQFGGWGAGCHGWGRSVSPRSYQTNATAAPITIQQATQYAKQYVAALNNPDLQVTEVEEYSQNFYVQVHEKSTEIGAFELLVDKYTGNVYPEMGPNMMWNTKYTAHTGMMRFFEGFRGMMGFQRTTQTPMTVTAEQAKTYAQQFLTQNYPGTIADEVKAFYGYYHVEVSSEGETFGMLSVNGYSGQVWFHNWHGNFIQHAEIA